ncbi:MAG TPA: hypothetical protein VF175_15315 [Lacipirellula sp.]
MSLTIAVASEVTGGTPTNGVRRCSSSVGSSKEECMTQDRKPSAAIKGPIVSGKRFH